MALELNKGTVPHNLEVQAYGEEGEHQVLIGGFKVSLEDFCTMAIYVLLNSDLREKDDPRIGLVTAIKHSETTIGRNRRKKRLHIPGGLVANLYK